MKNAEHGATAAPAVSARILLERLRGVVDSLTDEAYTTSSTVIKDGTIGAHVRHILDHFRPTLAAIGSGRVIEYDRRKRQTPVERGRAAAIAAIEEIRAGLADVDEATLSMPARIRVMLDAAGHEAELGTTIGRELHFAFHHAVHHSAMIKVMAGQFGIACPAEFGRAPADIEPHRAERA